MVQFNVQPLQSNVPIVTMQRTPTQQYQRFFQEIIAKVGASFADLTTITDNLTQAQADIQDILDDIIAILNGTTTFTGLKVDGKRVDNFVAYLDNAGEQIIDGNAFPYNVPSGSARAYASFPLTSTASSIAIAAVAFAIPNGTGNLVSGSVSGLAADTPYRVFYNPNINLYTAQPPPASAYLSSPDGWQFIGDIKTAVSGSSYSAPPALPPGFDPGMYSGGNYVTF